MKFELMSLVEKLPASVTVALGLLDSSFHVHAPVTLRDSTISMEHCVNSLPPTQVFWNHESPPSRSSPVTLKRLNNLNGALCEPFVSGTTVFWNHESALSRSSPELSQCHSRVVTVGQLVPWPHSSYSQRLNNLNGALREQFASGTTVFWNHESQPSRSSPELFLPDGVHLNDTGLHHYWQSLRTVVGRVLRHNQPSYQQFQS